MGFTEIEKKGKELFEQFPAVKRAAKRLYQLFSYAISNEKFKVEGDVVRVSPDDGFEYFYGYYDKSPWDATDRYMIALRVKQAYKSVAPKELGTVGVIDTQNENRFIEIGSSRSWNVQQGCMAQWMGPDFKSRIIFNDFRNGKYCSVIYDWTNKCEEKVLQLPVYDVAKDGSFALSLDFSRLHRLRPGYGYSNLPDSTKGELCPDKPCIWKVDINSGEVIELFRYTNFAAFEPDESMMGAEHKVNHLMISPNGKRFMVLHRWFQKGRKHTRLVTVNVDKTEMYNLSDDVFVSHCYWKNDYEILSFLRKKETGDHYYLMKDKTQEFRMLWQELNTDGHCSYSPDKSMVITDTYPNRKRLASVYLCTEKDNEARRIARVFAPFRYDNDCRCDLHPRWNHAGDKVCIDSVHNGKRALYILNLDLENNTKIYMNGSKERIKVAMVFSSLFDGLGICHNVFNYCSYIDESKFELSFYMINEPTPFFKNILLERNWQFSILEMRNSNQLSYIIELAKSLRKNKVDILHAHGNSATLALEMVSGLLARVPVRVAHSRNSGCKHMRAHKILKPLFNKSYNVGMAVSKEAGEWLFPSKPLIVLKNANDIENFKFNKEARNIERASLNIFDDEIAIGHVGTFNERKNQSFLIDVFNHLCKTSHKKYRLFLVGSGEQLDKISDKVRTLSLEDKVTFIGLIDNMPDFLQGMDIMLLPSLFEGLPNVLIEWQAAGLPSVVSDTVTREAQLTGLAVYLSLEKGAEKWADIVDEIPINDRVISSETALKEIRAAGFDVKTNVSTLEKIYIDEFKKRT